MAQAQVAWQVAVIYIGTLIGAGFASGQEILQFFVIHEGGARWGILLAVFQFAVLGVGVLKLSKHWGTADYHQFFQVLVGPSGGVFLAAVVTVFLFCGTATMLSAAAAVFAEHLGLPGALGLFSTITLCLFALWREIKGLVGLNSLLVPLKIVICCLVCIMVTFFSSLDVSVLSAGTLTGGHWLPASILYVSYNLILAVVVLVPVGYQLPANGQVSGGIGGALGIGLCGFIISSALQQVYPGVVAYEVPMLGLAKMVHPFLSYFYLIVLWGGILSTACANLYGLADRLSRIGWLNYRTTLLMVAAAVVPLACLRFSVLVSYLYPVFGYLGLLLMAGIYFQAWRVLVAKNR